MNLIIFGPPGAGKGTQSSFIVKKYNLYQISTGQILRDEIKNSTELGNKISSIINSGTLVSENMCRFLLRQKRLQRFARQALKLCNDDFTPNIIIDILAANVSAALICVMANFEKKYKGSIWTDICTLSKIRIPQIYIPSLKYCTPSWSFKS